MTPCDWPPDFTACGDTSAFNELDPADREKISEAVVDYLWRWSGEVFGVCAYVIRPCIEHRKPCRVRSGSPYSIIQGWRPALLGSRLYPLSCGVCPGSECFCADQVSALRLPRHTQEIISVTIDGAELDPSEYYFASGVLRRTEGRWPTVNDLSLPPGSPGTWEVDFTHGVPVPAGGKIAAGVLALEYAKALCGDSTCQLPERVQTITRQGVSMAFVDSMDSLDQGRTGIWLVDSWLASVTKPPRGGSVRSVDVPRRSIRVVS